MNTAEAIESKAERLRRRIVQVEAQLDLLRSQLRDLESADCPVSGPPTRKWPLDDEEYVRYSRQLILPGIGLSGQLHLKGAAVLVVGAGGLGCPAAAYLSGAGIGTLGIVDGDTVETSNLHRQIAHSTSKVGLAKVDSLADYCEDLNPRVKCIRYAAHLTPQNAAEIVSGYDIVLDCTDHPTSRYLISDICVLKQKPLVSASALRTDGQLIVLNSPAMPQGQSHGGPCYRCIYPKPTPAEIVVSCGEGGILGPVVGAMGALQALEAIKLLVASGITQQADSATPTLLLFSAADSTTFRSMRMRRRRPDCFACSTSSTLSVETLESGSLDYAQFCGVVRPIEIFPDGQRVSAQVYQKLLSESPGFEHLLLDVREREHFSVASLPGAVNVPYSVIAAHGSKLDPATAGWMPRSLPSNAPIYVICRIGNDSQTVAQRLHEKGFGNSGQRLIVDIKGGMRAWKRDVDSSIPFV